MDLLSNVSSYIFCESASCFVQHNAFQYEYFVKDYWTNNVLNFSEHIALHAAWKIHLLSQCVNATLNYVCVFYFIWQLVQKVLIDIARWLAYH